MTKEDLEFGNIVETRDGEKYIFNYIEGKSYFIRLDGAGFNPSKYYKNDLSIDDSNRESDIIKVYKDYTLKELLWERKEMPKLSDDEKAILRNIDKCFKWVARDKSGRLRICAGERLVKVEDYWYSKFYSTQSFPYTQLFKFIKWTDDEPYLIEDLLKEELK